MFSEKSFVSPAGFGGGDGIGEVGGQLAAQITKADVDRVLSPQVEAELCDGITTRLRSGFAFLFGLALLLQFDTGDVGKFGENNKDVVVAYSGILLIVCPLNFKFVTW